MGNSGKSHLAKLLKEKEVEHGSEPPRTLVSRVGLVWSVVMWCGMVAVVVCGVVWCSKSCINADPRPWTTTSSVTGSTSMRQRWRPSIGGEQPFLKFLVTVWNLTFFIRSNLEKSFKKNIDGGYFPFLVVDAINEKVDHFSGMWSHAKQNGFEVSLESFPS